jgi:hypothetical protein
MKRLLFAGAMFVVATAVHADTDSEGFWVGPRYYWPDGNMSTTVYDKRNRAYTYLDRSEPTMADLPSWLRYPPKPPWRVIGRSRQR